MKPTVVPIRSVSTVRMVSIKTQAFFLATTKVAIRCVSKLISLLLPLFQIRSGSNSCLTVHDVYGSQSAKRTPRLNLQTCQDRTHAPRTAMYQVRNRKKSPTVHLFFGLSCMMKTSSSSGKISIAYGFHHFIAERVSSGFVFFLHQKIG